MKTSFCIRVHALTFAGAIVGALAGATSVSAQQEMYACTRDAHFIRVLDYATLPASQTLSDQSQSIFWVADMAVRPASGVICATYVPGIDSIVEFDPVTGQQLSLCTVFGVQSWAIDCDATGALVGQKWDNLPSRIFSEHNTQEICVNVAGAVTTSLNRTDIATEGPGTLLSLRLNSTIVERIDRATGALLGAYDVGQSFEGIEVDTDGSIYGLTQDGILWSVTLSPPSATALGLLEAPASGDVWIGLAFRHPPLAIDVQPVCDGLPNSVGQMGRLVVGDPSGAGPSTLGLRVDGLPPGRTAILLYGTAAGNRPLGAGVLCIGSPLVRVPGVGVADASGAAHFAVDLSMFPGVGQTMAGDSFVFQCLYRDALAVNLSSASTVTIL